MDRSTEITIRSAIIIACMILVPLWAVMGTSWTVVLNVDSSTDTPAHPPTRGKSSGETQREPVKSTEFPSMASVAAPKSSAIPSASPLTVTAPLVPPTGNIPPVAQPSPVVPTPPVPSASPTTTVAPTVAATTPVTPPPT
ncbi:MAG: hypothetical protein JNM18_07935, partial [Planctomycetaceae bacterium]|nr:hypothetical protein [Planctomycetaceae bacterium]